MQTIEINKGLHIGFEDILRGIQQLDNQSLAHFAGEINRLVSNRNPENLNREETELLKKIKMSIPHSLKRRQKQLYAKLQDESILTKEREELELLNNMIEEKTAERILLLGELARLKGISLQELHAQLQF